MIRKLWIILLIVPVWVHGQNTVHFADSVRKAYDIPELSYSVVTDSTVLEIAALGHHSAVLNDTATLNDRFHLGSDTKAMTAFIIAKFVEEGKLTWATKFFDIYPEWEVGSKPVYYSITLEELLSHRARIQPFEGGEDDPAIPQFIGTKQEKRTAFGKYVLTLPPAKTDSSGFAYSNAGYTLAALMVEKASGMSWEQLVEKVFNKDLKLEVGLSWPDNQKHKDTWGHIPENGKLVPVPSDTSYRLDYTEPAGDLNIKLKDYVRFVQMNIQGMKGYGNYLHASDYKFIHKGVPYYSLGWFNINNGEGDFSTHTGTAGTYYALVTIDRKKFIGYIIFTNSFNDKTVNGVRVLLRKLKAEYGR